MNVPGKPKGIVHTQAGYLLYTSTTHKYVFDYRDGDVYACVADCGYVLAREDTRIRVWVVFD